MLRSLRRDVLWTQEELAERSGVSVATIAGIESGRVVRPRGASLRMLADALGLSDRQRAAFVAAARGDEPVAPAGGSRPAQLPNAVAGFVGRVQPLRALDDLVAGDAFTAVRISVISGAPGVGKTALALRWAHRVRDRFPDGQLYVNLRGFDRSGAVMDPAEAVRGFLAALGVAPHRIPADLDSQAALYRSLLSDKRVLVVLDNARDTNQVRPLLPGSPGCLVVVTSRNDLIGLVTKEAARPLTLGVLSDAESRQLLDQRLGADRTSAEPHAVDQIIVSCARLPLALAVVAARAAVRPDFPLAALTDALTGADPDTDLRVVFSWSYQQLSPAAQRLFRLLGLHPGPDISAAAAVSLAGGPPPLAELTRAHLLSEHVPGRYTFHDLLRAYATGLAHADDSGNDRQAATRRMLDHYLHTSFAGDRLLYPQRDPIALAEPAEGVVPEPLADGREAMTWFSTERPVLHAAVTTAALDTYVWPLTWALTTFAMRQGHLRDLATLCQTALTVTRRAGDQAAQARIHRNLGRIHVQLREVVDARSHLRQSLQLSAALRDRTGQARAYADLGWSYGREGDHAKALDYTQRALEHFRASDHQAGLANAYNAIGWYRALLGEPGRALSPCTQALTLYEQIGDRAGQADTWKSLGYTHHRLGQYEAALDCYRRALDLCRQAGGRYTEASTLTHLADTQHASGDTSAARQSWQQAAAILDKIDHPTVPARGAELSWQLQLGRTHDGDLPS